MLSKERLTFLTLMTQNLLYFFPAMFFVQIIQCFFLFVLLSQVEMVVPVLLSFLCICYFCLYLQVVLLSLELSSMKTSAHTNRINLQVMDQVIP